jgi:hypothetical protein
LTNSAIGAEGNSPPEPEIQDAIVRAWQRAYYIAFNRSSPEIAAEHLLVGLSDEFGEALLPFFVDAEPLCALVERVRAMPVRDKNGDWPPGDLLESSPAAGCGGVGFMGLGRSREFEEIIITVARQMDTPPPRLLGMDGFMRIVAESTAASRLERDYGLQFR